MSDKTKVELDAVYAGLFGLCAGNRERKAMKPLHTNRASGTKLGEAMSELISCDATEDWLDYEDYELDQVEDGGDDCIDCGMCDWCIERTRAFFEEMESELP